MFLASIKVFSSSNSNLSGVLLRDEMFKPFAFTATRQELFLNFVSGIGDSQPWVAVDLGPVRLIQSVSIAQSNEKAIIGASFYFTNHQSPMLESDQEILDVWKFLPHL